MVRPVRRKKFSIKNYSPFISLIIPLIIFFFLGGALIYFTKNSLDNRQRASTPSVNIVDFGATPNDSTDDTAAIKNAISSAQSQGKVVYVPAGRFNHTLFYLYGMQMFGDGDTSILYAPNPDDIQIILQGDKSSLTNIKVSAATTVRSNSNKFAVYMENATNFTINHVTVDGANDAGILSYRSSFGQITDNNVQNTLADAIHTTAGSHDIYIARNVVRNPGDDMIAVVSYNGGQCSNQAGFDMVYNVLIENNDVANSNWGRGISVVGGKDITIRNNKIANSSAAGLYIASESSYNTCSVSNVRIESNTIDGTATSSTVIHPAVLIYSGAVGQSIHEILLANNIVSNTPARDGIQVRNVSTNIAFMNNAVTNTNGGLVNDSSGNIYCSGNTFNGSQSPITPCGGSYNFTVSGSSVTPVVSTPTPSPTATLTPPTPTTSLNDTVAPSIVVTAPINGSIVKRGSTISIDASATDNFGISKVEFYVNGTLICTDATVSYNCLWGVPGKRNTYYTVTAKAYDTSGNKSSTAINVTAR